MEISEAHLNDRDKIFKLLGELNIGSVNKQRFDSIYQADINNTGIFYFVAKKDRDLVGYICGSIEDRLGHDEKIATVRGLVVSTAYRNQGIGTKLLQAFEEIAKEKNCEKIEVLSKIGREDAHRFYIRKAGMLKTHYRFSKNLN